MLEHLKAAMCIKDTMISDFSTQPKIFFGFFSITDHSHKKLITQTTSFWFFNFKFLPLLFNWFFNLYNLPGR